ncbi:FAD/NAD(P)-binding domain-containing protein [Zopfia rhizophila CBS 207.26]|uniref:FAD/NAD(P)-binding domain-containing protein n=1 Tax=Zopfia rhizophila CBS 207.26 TaxID=1314779 RepID=A0A6A6EKY7_9PEZI|nr:FAD/NAD(P)-binding domain-containing protein [Zopfia rhizophila CBS 207.26]
MPRAPFLFFLLSLAFNVTRAVIDESNFPSSNIITRDVAIIGGGASGTYAAVRLREDLNTSIVVIEPQNRLGGHVETYTIPGTNTTIEFGVQSYIRYGPAPSFFERFGVDTITFASRRLTTINVDIETGKALAGYTPPPSNATTEAFKTWLQFVEKYEPFMEPGYWNFPPPDAIPADFLIPFGEFAKKQNIEAAVPRIAAISDVGAGGLKDALTLYVIQAFGAPITRGLLENSLFVPVGSNSLLYQRAYDLLKKDVYLESSIKEVERNPSGVRIIIKNKDGAVLIKAKRVLWTPYPSHEKNLENFDEDEKEIQVFGPWIPSWSFVGILSIPCIPENYSIAYLSPAAVPSNYLAIRDYPYTLRFDSTGPSGLGLFRALFSTNYSITHLEAKETITQNIQKLVTAGTLNYTGDCEVEYKAFVDHIGVIWPQGKEELENGFVQKLYGLQGYRSTWWSGRSWGGYYTSNVWSFTDTVLERMLKELKRRFRSVYDGGYALPCVRWIADDGGFVGLRVAVTVATAIARDADGLIEVGDGSEILGGALPAVGAT